ncbi:MAG: hypothetical protein KDE27_17670 [Planctomycetes bacterium]|nr:hypothetical protein [Planctomycetota bacterium]
MRTLASALCLLALAACAPSVYRADVGAIFVKGQGEIALQNAGGTLALSDNNRFSGQLGLDDFEASPYLRLEWGHERHRVRAHGFGVNSNGSGRLANDFGGIVANTPVNTSMDFFSAAASYAYEVFENEWFQLGLGGALGYVKLNVDVRSQAGPGRDEVDTDVLVPMPFADAEFRLGDVSIGANAGVMSADLGDGNGRYWDVEGIARWQITPDVQVLGGYRLLSMDVLGNASGRDFDADLQFHGWFFGGGVTF